MEDNRSSHRKRRSGREYEDPFNRLMFGQSRLHKDQREKSPQSPGEPSLDFDELITNLDALIESTKNLKPVFKKLLPTFEKWWKKWKEDG